MDGLKHDTKWEYEVDIEWRLNQNKEWRHNDIVDDNDNPV